MSLLNLNLPIIGGTNANEDPKVRTALSDIQTVVNALDNTNIAAGADINGSKLDDATVSAAKLAANSVETAKIADGAVTTAKIADGTIATADIANSAVTADKIGSNAVTSAKIADGTIVNGDIAASTIAPGKLSPVVGEANLFANVGLNYAAWNTVLTVNTGQAGTYVMMASGTFGAQNSNDIQISINTPTAGGTYSTWGMVVNGNPYGSFSQQGIGYSTNGVINLAIYSYVGKQSVGSGTRLSVFRIG